MTEKTIERTKLFKTDIKKVINNTQESIKMTIDENAISHIVERLTDLYNNPIESVVRELISNAIDSMIEANSKKSIIIDLNLFNNNFSIQDFGTGMDLNDLITIYSKYGASTKRNNMNVVGAFGLGAKVPLAYTNSFTIISVKNNKEITALITKTESGPEIKIIQEIETNKENGVTITIPLLKENDYFEFNKVLRNYYLFSDSISIPIQFPFIENNLEKVEKTKNTIALNRDTELNFYSYQEHCNSDKTVSNFLYNVLIKEEKLSYKNGSLEFVLEGFVYKSITNNYYRRNHYYVSLVPGLVDFNTSREAIIENDRLAQLEEKINKEIQSFDYKKEDKKFILEFYTVLLNNFNNGFLSDKQKEKLIYYIKDIELFLNMKPVNLEEIFSMKDVKIHSMNKSHSFKQKKNTRKTITQYFHIIFFELLKNKNLTFILYKTLNNAKIRQFLLENPNSSLIEIDEKQKAYLEEYFSLNIINDIKLSYSKSSKAHYNIFGEINLKSKKVNVFKDKALPLSELKNEHILFVDSNDYYNFSLDKSTIQKVIFNHLNNGFNDTENILIIDTSAISKRLLNSSFNKNIYIIKYLNKSYQKYGELDNKTLALLKKNNQEKIKTIQLIDDELYNFITKLDKNKNDRTNFIQILTKKEENNSVKQWKEKNYQQYYETLIAIQSYPTALIEVVPQNNAIKYLIKNLHHMIYLTKLLENVTKEEAKNSTNNTEFFNQIKSTINNELNSLIYKFEKGESDAND